MALFLGLFCFSVLSPVEGQGPSGWKKLLVLDLSEIQLAEVNRDYPNLTRLVATGSTGIVNLAKCSFDGSFIQHLRLQRWISGSTNTILFQQSVPAAKTPKNQFPGQDRNRCIQSNRIGLLRDYDGIVGRILRRTDFKTTLLLGCFAPEGIDPKRKKPGLAVVVFKGLGFERGVLYSPSTRKPGIITFYDLKTMVRQFAAPGVSPVFAIQQRPGHWRNVSGSQRELIQNYLVRQPVLTVYGYLMLGCLGALVGGIFFRSSYAMRSFIWIYLFLLAVPGAFLLMAAINPLKWHSIFFYSVGISGFLFGLSFFGAGKKPGPTLAWLSFLTVGLILIDGLFNGFYEYKSLLGYSAVSGGRYHGIGNEYMGILLGAYITGVSLSLKKINNACARGRPEMLWSAAFLIGLILIHPSLGADVGGGISAIIGLGVTNYFWLHRPIRWKELLQLGTFTGLALAIAAFWDLVLNRANMSHWGQLLLAIHTSGWDAFQTIVIRKLAMNLSLIRTTPLAILLILVLLAIPVLYHYPTASVKGLMNRYPEVMAGIAGLSITALVGFLANDSGIVSAALIFMFGTGMMAWMIHGEPGLEVKSSILS